MLYNIYAGLGGSFGGPQYDYTIDCKSKEEAENLAYESAVNIYESYEGLRGILDIDDCRKVSDSEEEAEEMYQNEIESWIEYYAVPTDEDTETKRRIMDSLTNIEKRLKQLGFFNSNVRNANVGESDYSKHTIQPWSIWQDYNLDPWDADIVKRVLRTKKVEGKTAEESRIEDYKKIIHICKEKLRQLGIEEKNPSTEIVLNQKEVGNLYDFIGNLEDSRNSSITIKQENTGIGVVTTVSSDNKEQDITDYEAW